MAGLFQILYGKQDGTYSKAVPLNGSDGDPLIIQSSGKEERRKMICTRPFAADWDADGDLDLIVGNFDGTFFLFKGEGEGGFSPTSTQLMAGEEPLKINGYHSDPCVVDWDGDGDLDIISGSTNGDVQISENVGTKTEAKLSAFKNLIAQTATTKENLGLTDLKGPTKDSRVTVKDINNDGKLDILVGDNTTLTSPADDIDPEKYNSLIATWQSEYEVISSEYSSATSAIERKKALTKMSVKRTERRKIVKETRTGFVWLYLQK